MQNTPPYSRRRFLKQSTATGLGAVACLGAMGLATDTEALADSDKSDSTDKRAKIIDIHTHVSSYLLGGGLSVPKLLEWMDGHDIEKAVVMPLVSPEGWDFPIATDWVLDQTRDHRKRLIPFCDIDPRTPLHENQIRTLIKQYVKQGAKGFGEHKCAVPIDDPRNVQLFKIAGEFHLPVLFHLDNIRNTDKPGLSGLEKVLQALPKTQFIGHAQGWWASISGDVTADQMGIYPRGPVTPGGALDRLMKKYPNLYGDISAGSGANAFRRDLKFGREFILRHADRLLFGSDYLQENQKILQFDLLREMKLPIDVENKIRRTNAEKLLG